MKNTKTLYPLELDFNQIRAYISVLQRNTLSLRTENIGTVVSEFGIRETIEKYGNFVLGTIDPHYLRNTPSDTRASIVEKLFQKTPKNLAIPPIIIRDYHPNQPDLQQRMELYDGQTRSGIAYEKGIPILGYAPKGLIEKIEGFNRIE